MIKPISFMLLATVGLASCSRAPKRSEFGLSSKSGSNNSETGTETETEGKDDPDSKESTDSNSAADTVALSGIIGKIMQDKYDCSAKSTSGPPELRLLTSEEYQRTVQDVLKVAVDYRSQLPKDPAIFGFKNNTSVGTVSDSHATSYMDAAINIADETRPKLKTLVGCDETEGATCAQKIIDDLGAKLWRRPLTADESKPLVDLFSKTYAKSKTEAMSLLLASILNSPNFLYRSEIGKNGALSAYELASALSYFFWGTVPDKELRDLAVNGTLIQDSVLLAQASRLLKDPKSVFVVNDFSNGWLGASTVKFIAKDATKYPQWTQDIKNDLVAESEKTFEYIFRQPTASYKDLVASDFTIGSERLASYYGTKTVKDGSVTKIDFSKTTRRGVLGYGAILASLASQTETNPFKRGDFVLSKIFCDLPPPTPEGLKFEPPKPDETLTSRERFAQHSNKPACKGCHIGIDGIGFGMEDFDAVGLFRTEDNGKAVDASGTVVHIDGKDRPFDGAGQLSAHIADSRQAKRCYVMQWYRLAQGRIERERDVCAVRELADQFEAGTLPLSELVIKVITHKSFTKRGE